MIEILLKGWPVFYNGAVKKRKEVAVLQVEIKIDSSYSEPKVIILTASVTEDVSSIVRRLSEDASQIISGYRDEKIEILEQADLIRIYANSEIIHLKKVKNFDLSFTGTICVKLSNGMTTYVSRRYVPKLKKILGI